MTTSFVITAEKQGRAVSSMGLVTVGNTVSTADSNAFLFLQR